MNDPLCLGLREPPPSDEVDALADEFVRAYVEDLTYKPEYA